MDPAFPSWKRIRVSDLQPPPGKNKEWILEEAIATHPELLGIGAQDDPSRIRGPFRCFRQVQLKSVARRANIFPDIVFLSASGDIIVVEVKLHENPELKRHVVGQLLEYAASLSSLDERALLRLFGGDPDQTTWANFVDQSFHNDVADTPKLALELLSKIQNRDLTLVVASDGTPHDLASLVDGIKGMSPLGEYEFRLVDIVPYRRDGDGTDVVLMPATRIRTEVVARTAVIVSTDFPASRLSVEVETTSLEETTRAADAARRGTRWTYEAFFEQASANLNQDQLGQLHSVYDALVDSSFEVSFGSGRTSGTFRVRSDARGWNNFLIISDVASLTVDVKPLDDASASAVREGLRKMGLDSGFRQWREFRAEQWLPQATALTDLVTVLSGNT